MKNRIVIVGSSNTDMVVRVDHFPLPGETLMGNNFLTAQGGKGANQAVAVARLGKKGISPGSHNNRILSIFIYRNKGDT